MAKSLLPRGGFRYVGRAARSLFARTDAMLFQMRQLEALLRAMDAAPGAAGSGAARCVPLGLPPPARTRAAATAALSALAAPAGAARPARGRRRGRGPRGSAAAGGLMCATPGPALCRLRAAGRRALLPTGTRRAAHERGASVCGGASARGGASAAGVVAARIVGRGRIRGGAQAAQGSPSARKRRRSRSPSPARVTRRARGSPGEAPRPPPPPPSVSRGGGGAQPKRLWYGTQAGRAALPAPPRGNRRARGGTRGTGVTRTGRAPGRTHTRGGGYNRVHNPPPPLPRAGGYFWGHLPPADGGSGGVISQRGGH